MILRTFCALYLEHCALYVKIKQSHPFPLYSHPQQPQTYFLALRICKLWTIHIKWITHHVYTFTQYNVSEIHSCCSMLSVHSFLWPNNTSNMLLLYHILFIHSSVDEHLCYFHFLIVVNSVIMNIHEQIVWILVFNPYGYYLEVELLVFRVTLWSTFSGTVEPFL